MSSDFTSPRRLPISDSPAEERPPWMRWQTLKELHQTVSGDGMASAPNEEPTWQPIEREPVVEARDHPDPGARHEQGVSDAVESSEPSFSALDVRDRVVIMLLFKQVITMEQVEAAWRRWQERTGGSSREPLWRVLARDPSFDRDRILEEAARTAGFKTSHIDPVEGTSFLRAQADRLDPVNRERLVSLRTLPVAYETPRGAKGERLIFVSPDPSRPEVSRLVRELRLPAYELRYAPEEVVERMVAALSDSEEEDATPERSLEVDAVGSATGPLTKGSDDVIEALRASIGEREHRESGAEREDRESIGEREHRESGAERGLPASIGERNDMLDRCLSEAVRLGATDIHIYPAGDSVQVDMRIGGRLQAWSEGADELDVDLLASAKQAANNIDPADRDSAQDGMVRREIDGVVRRFRVSVLPIANGESREESVVIRPLETATDLEGIGFDEATRVQVHGVLRQSRGMVILAGPSGSGKTAATHGLLRELLARGLNAITLEETVEERGIRQVRLSSRLDHEEALEAVRRHDADVVMLGDVRTKEMAELALKVANADHLVVARFTAYDTAGVVGRLLRWGIEPVLIAYAMELIVAQRTVRALCPECKKPSSHVDGELLRTLGFSPSEIAGATFFEEEEGRDCSNCGGAGFAGRRLAAEALAFSDEVRRLVALADEPFDEDDLRALAIRGGMATLRASARDVVKRGETTISELIRATAGEH